MNQFGHLRLSLGLFALITLFIHMQTLAEPSQRQVIYGKDDRQDFYSVQSQELQSLAQSTVAIIDKDTLFPAGSKFTAELIPATETDRLCPEENFSNQPTLSSCTGVLVEPDLVLTAGHCLPTTNYCDLYYFVFNYRQTQAGLTKSTFTQSEVYECKELLTAPQDSATGIDYALVRLKRPVQLAEAKPVERRSEGVIAVDEPLVMMGHPMGLPLKIAGGAKVRSVESTYFVANLDSFGGNSGSPIYNQNTKKLEGILVRGETDFETDLVRNCKVSKVCLDDGCRGEDVLKITEVCHLNGKECQPPTAGANSCEYAFDGQCDDGRTGAAFKLCDAGTDEYDCQALDEDNLDFNQCFYSYNGRCDDGRRGSETSLCRFKTDEVDCEGLPYVDDILGPNSCIYAKDNQCDDGRPGAKSNLCAPGTDQLDCEPKGVQ